MDRTRDFTVRIHKSEYKKICEWTLMKKNIETGGDLFGLWFDSYTPVVQLVLGPGKGVRRSSVSFFQDVKYLENVGSYLTQNEGLCHIGEWHSHHQIGLERPSGGDVNTVWSNMPRYNLGRFFIFIANIQNEGIHGWRAKASCFLFEFDPLTHERLPVLLGRIELVDNDESPLCLSVSAKVLQGGAESVATGENIEILSSNDETIWCAETKGRSKFEDWYFVGREEINESHASKRIKLGEKSEEENLLPPTSQPSQRTPLADQDREREKDSSDGDLNLDNTAPASIHPGNDSTSLTDPHVSDQEKKTLETYRDNVNVKKENTATTVWLRANPLVTGRKDDHVRESEREKKYPYHNIEPEREQDTGKSEKYSSDKREPVKERVTQEKYTSDSEPKSLAVAANSCCITKRQKTAIQSSNSAKNLPDVCSYGKSEQPNLAVVLTEGSEIKVRTEESIYNSGYTVEDKNYTNGGPEHAKTHVIVDTAANKDDKNGNEIIVKNENPEESEEHQKTTRSCWTFSCCGGGMRARAKITDH